MKLVRTAKTVAACFLNDQFLCDIFSNITGKRIDPFWTHPDLEIYSNFEITQTTTEYEMSTVTYYKIHCRQAKVSITLDEVLNITIADSSVSNFDATNLANVFLNYQLIAIV